jgi:phosphoglycolate phosphatase
MTSREIVKFVGLANWQLLLWLVYFRMAQSRYSGDIKLFVGIVEVLEKLKNSGEYRFFVLSSNSRKNIENVLLRAKCTVFDKIYSESSLYKKDEALKKIAKEIGVDVSAITYVGDELRDYEACKRSGIPFVGVAWGYNTAEALTTHGVTTLALTVQELATIL